MPHAATLACGARPLSGGSRANRAWALFLLGRTAEARQSLEEAGPYANVPSKPGAAGVHYHMALALAAGGLHAEAAEHLRQVKSIDPQGRYVALADSLLRS